MEELRYTSFPDLRPESVRLTDVSAFIERTIEAGDVQLPTEVILLAWADLLRSYSDEDLPIFDFNGKAVRADTSNRAHSIIDDHSLQLVGSTTRTAVFVDESSVHGSTTPSRTIANGFRKSSDGSLELHYMSTEATITLISRLPMSAEFVDQVGYQFLLFAKRQLGSAECAASYKGRDIELSILNPEPRFLAGAKLLHHLISWTDNASCCAIDSLDGQGVRSYLSYQSLDEHSTSLAKRITQYISQIPDNSLDNIVIPVLIPQSVDLYVAQIATLKAGAAFCPLNLDAPHDRIDFILEDVSARLVLTVRKFKDKFSDVDKKIIVLTVDEEHDDTENLDIANLPSQPHPEKFAYVMYTSGSTGLPKGVGVSHRAATQALLAHDRHIPTFRRFIQFAAPTFDVSVFEIYFPLFRGVTLVCCDRAELLTDLSGKMAQLDIDAAELTPTVAGSLLRTRNAVPSLTVLLTIGEMLNRAVVDEFGKGKHRGSLLYGMYGPTEAAIHCTVSPSMNADSKVGMIGVPFDTVSVFVISIAQSEGQGQSDPSVLPIGQTGELAVGGYQLASGYINRPEQTAQAFIEHSKYGKLYRTGDKVRLLPGGELECLGRISSGQVKLRGQRVELGEIEQVICKIPEIQLAIASVVEGSLVAFCVTENVDILPEHAQQMCRKWLPKFMIPGDCLMLPTVPRLPSGKVDKKKLEQDYRESRHTAPNDENFEDEIEETVARCVSELFGRSINRLTSLSRSGLDSLSAIQLASALRNSGILLSALTILEADSVHEVYMKALEVQNRGDMENGTVTDPAWPELQSQNLESLLEKDELSMVERVLPTSPVQQAMLAETLSNPRAYFNWIRLRIEPDFDFSQVSHAFSALAVCNEILRSGFVETDVPDRPFAQVLWKGLADCQFEAVHDFQFDAMAIDNLGPLRPLHVQMQQVEGRIEVLVHLHHALYDGWSWELILADLQDLLRGREPIIRPQYYTLTKYVLTEIRSAPSSDSIMFWREYLRDSNLQPFPNFNDTTDIPVRIVRFGRRLNLSGSSVSEGARRLQISRTAYFQASFLYILASYLGTPDVTLGVVSSGRTLALNGIESIIGPCMATLPMKLDISSCRTVNDLLTCVQNLNRRLAEYGSVPLREIKKLSGADETKPLFDVLFVWQETLRTSQEQLDNIIEVDSRDFSEFVLVLEIEPRGDAIHARVSFQQSILPLSQAQILLDQLETLANIFIERPGHLVEEIDSIVDPKVLSMENKHFCPSRDVGSVSLVGTVERLARQDPSRTAVLFARGLDVDSGALDIEPMTYAQLNSRSNKIATHLRHKGVQPDDLICVFMEKSVDLYVSILGVIKSGAGYVPLTPQTPIERVKTIVEEANIRICLTRSVDVGKLADLVSPELLLADKLDLKDTAPSDPGVQVGSSNLAYAVFTSGSTGKPKGVLVTRGNLLSNLEVLSDIYPCNRESRLLQACSQAFDVSVFEIFFTWHRGICLCSASNDVLFRDLEATIRAMKVTHLSLTPTVAALITPENVPDVEFLVIAGEALTPKVFQNWAGRGLYQGYGPSEATNICTVKPKLLPGNLINDIGPPLRNTSALVVSDRSDITPILRGGVGELCFGGEQVARSYLNLPDQTSDKFINVPAFGRVYRSGDIGRVLPGGNIVFLGRKDDQVKLRGQRIELGEVNETLLGLTEVDDCVSIVVEDAENRSQRLVTFWKPIHQLGISKEKLGNACLNLFEALEQRLPTYMIPSTLIPMHRFPRTSQGKINKRVLEDTLSNLSQYDANLFSRKSDILEDEEDISEGEMQIMECVSSVTGVPSSDIRRHSSFFSLGLDSISAVTLSKALRKKGLGQVDVSSILKNSSIFRLHQVISATSNGHIAYLDTDLDSLQLFDSHFLESMRTSAEMSGFRVEQILPCTPLQEAMLMNKDDSNTPAYFNHTVFKLHINSVEHMRNAWMEMTNRHSILRTCFAFTSSLQYPVAQIVLENIELPWATTIISSTKFNQEVQNMQRRLGGMVGEFTPMFQLNLISCPDQKSSSLVLSMHHALYDAEALKQLLSEIETLLHGGMLDSPVQWTKFLHLAVSSNNEISDRFWSKNLASFRPFKWKRRVQTSSTFAVSHLQASSSLSYIDQRCQQESVTLLAVCQATWAKLMYLYLNTFDVCFGNVFSGRTVPIDGIERIVGPCFNTLPIRIMSRPDKMNKDLVQQLQKINAEIMPFQLSSLRRIQAQNADGGSHLFDTMLLLQGRTQDLDHSIWSLERETGVMNFPLILEIQPDPSSDQLTLSLHFDETYLTVEDSGRILDHYSAALETCLQYPSGKAIDPSIFQSEFPVCVKRMTQVPHSKENFRDKNGPVLQQEWTELEKEIGVVLSQLAGVSLENLTLDVTIFQLGLDSINAVQVATQLRKQGHGLSSTDVLEAPTVRQLARFISEKEPEREIGIGQFDFDSFDQSHRHRVCQQLRMADESIESVRPCTPVQAGMLAEYLVSDGDLYFNHLVVKIDPDIAIHDIRQSWDLAFQRYEMLRTGFYHTEDSLSPYLMITYRPQFSKLPWREIDCQGNSIREDRHQLRRDMLTNLHLPAWRVAVWSGSEGTHIEFSAHHALYDAQSLNVILNEVIRGLDNRPNKPVVPISRTLGAIIHASSIEDEARPFWESLNNKLWTTKFPDLNPNRVQSSQTLSLRRLTSVPLLDLQEGCQDEGVTLQAAGQVAWARLLSAYVGEPTVTFGLVLSGRDFMEEAQEVAFPCLTTVPFPCHINGANEDLLQQAMKLNASLIRHQFTPFSKIERWAGAEKNIFDSLFVYQKLGGDELDSGPWDIIEEVAKVEYAISIELIPTRNQELELRLTFQDDRLPCQQASMMLDQFDELLKDTIFAPGESSADSSRLIQNVLSIIPAKDPEIPSDAKLLHEFVEIQARKQPEACALEFAFSIADKNVDMKRWTYAELNAKGDDYARLILSYGAAPGDLVGICFDKCPQAYFAILGILKAGCAYVALDPGAPIARKKFIVDDSASRLLLCNSDQKGGLQGIEHVPIIVVGDSGIFANLPPAPFTQPQGVSPQSTCYCLYTSGTTGTPKGCEITHENAVQAMKSFQRLFTGHWCETSRWLQFASFHFDVSVLEQYWSWSVGICVTSTPRDVIFEDIAEAICKLQITHIDLTPSLARLLHPSDVPSLCRGVFITGGEQLKQEILDAWGHKGVIYNGYGPTEVTIGCTMYPRVPKNAKPSNIGPQFDNVSSQVLQPNTDIPVLHGGVGELCVSGKLVGRGYLNRPDLTARKFQILASGEKQYRTGDLVRLLHNGDYDFLGRIDDQVKLRGQRLEIAEIDQVIRSGTVSQIEVATLVLKHPKQAKEQLVSFICPSTGGKNAERPEFRRSESHQEMVSQVRDACLQALPGYMVPTYILPISAMPLNANNKSDTNQLKTLFEGTSSDELQKFSSSASNLSQADHEDLSKIINVLAEYLQMQSSDISDRSSIFELGLDSIAAIGFTRALKQSGFERAHASLIMKHPVVSALAIALRGTDNMGTEAAHINARRSAEQTIRAFSHRHKFGICETLGVSATDIEHIAPCTPLQEGMISRSTSSDRPVYFSTFAFELDPEIKVDRLRCAWEMTQSALQILRTKFVSTSDGYSQVVLRDAKMRWETVGVDPESDLMAKIQDRGEAFWLMNKDVNNFLWEVVIFRQHSKSIMCLNIFHGLYDGNSLPMILDAVRLAYDNKRSEIHAPSFHDILADGPLCELPTAKNFWMRHLSQPANPHLPLKEDVSDKTYSIVKKSLNIPSSFRRTSRKLHVTDQSILHASWLLGLAEQFGFLPTLGVVVSGRSIDVDGAESVIGPMFNTIPSSIRLHGATLYSDIIQRCHEYNVLSLPFQHTPLRNIMKWLKRRPENHLVETLFVYQKESVPRTNIEETLWTPLDVASEPDHPLAFEAQANIDDTMNFTIVAHSNVLDRREVTHLLDLVYRYFAVLIEDSNSHLPVEVIQIADKETLTESSLPPQSPVAEGSHPNGTFDLSWTETGLKIRQQIAQLANVDEDSIFPDQSILELGLDSIDSIKLSSRLSKIGVRIPVSSIMRLRTIERMCTGIRKESDDGDVAMSDIAKVENDIEQHLRDNGEYTDDIEGVLPPTPLQEAMVAEMIASDYEHYFNHDVLELRADINIERLMGCWKELARVHPILRTSFVEIDSPGINFTYTQVIKKRELSAGVISVDSEDQLQNKLTSCQVEKPADIRAALFWIKLVRSPNRAILVMSIAHALYDGWSLNLIHQDIQSLYEGQTLNRATYEPVLEKIMSASGDDAAEFWRSTLAGAPSTLLPARAPKSKSVSQVHRNERASLIPAPDAKEFCQSHGVTMQALGLTCWCLVLAHRVKRLDIVFGMVLSGRDTDESSEAIFPTMNTVAVRAVLHGSQSDMVRYMQDTIADISKYQHYPLRKAKAGTSLSALDLFNTLFIYQKKPSSQSGHFEPLYKSVGSSSDVEYPVCVELEVDGINVVWRAACKDAYMDEAESQDLLDCVDDVLQSLIQHPDEPVVTFESQRACICGMSSFTVENQLPQGNHGDTVDFEVVNDSRWSDPECHIRAVLSTVSGIPEDEIGKNMTLFHLGLDSISAIKIVSLLRKRSIFINVSEMLQAGTIPRIAQKTRSAREPASAYSPDHGAVLQSLISGMNVETVLRALELSSSDVETVMPTTPGQTFMLSSWLSSKGAIFYPTFSYEIRGDVRRWKLDQAWDNLVQQFPIFRTSFHSTGLVDRPFLQIVRRKYDSPVCWNFAQDASLQCQNFKDPFKLPPVSVSVFQQSQRMVFCIRIHHALYDGVSLPKMIQALENLYNNPGELPRSNPDLAEFVAFDHAQSDIESRKTFWEKYLDVDSTSLTPVSDTPLQERCNVYKPRIIEKATILTSLAKSNGVSIHSLFLAAYAKIHAHFTQRKLGKDVVIGVYLANRSHALEGLPDLVAPTMNLVPVVVRNVAHGDLIGVARQVQSDLHEVGRIENSGVSLWEIAEWTSVKVDCFVNFLTLPDTEGSNEVMSGSHDRLRFVEIRDSEVSYSPSGASPDDGYFQSIDSPAADANIPSIDVEAAIRDEGLDVGVFGPRCLLDDGMAESILSQLKMLLQTAPDADAVS